MNIPFVQALKVGRTNRTQIQAVVIHTAEIPCEVGMAERLAIRWAKPSETDDSKSAHYAIDPGTIIKCVEDTTEAWHCRGFNGPTIGIEHAGRGFPALVKRKDGTPVKYDPTDWLSGEGLSVLSLSAILVASICFKWKIPVRRLTPSQLVSGERGLCGHGDATVAFKVPGGHTDPGPNWPWEKYLREVQNELLALNPSE